MSAHSIIAPSSAGRWGPCPGSPLAEAKYPETERSQPALEGEASHHVGGEVLLAGGRPNCCNDFIGTKLDNGILVNREMVDAAMVYVKTVQSVATRDGLRVEKAVRIPRVHAQCFGTPDAWYFDTETWTLHIWDYKYGWGLVEAFENQQAVCYYGGILDELGIVDDALKVVTHIVQPRPYHPDGVVRPWRVLATDLRGHLNTLANSAVEVFSPTPRYVTGAHCRYCKGRRACLSAEQAAMHSVDISGTAVPSELTNEGVGIELAILRRAAKALEYRITGLEAQGLELAKHGAVIPGQRVAHGAGSTVWTKPVGEILALGDLADIDLRKPAEVCTPKQAITKGIDKALIAVYSEHRSGAARLVPDDNSRARQIFGGIKQ